MLTSAISLGVTMTSALAGTQTCGGQPVASSVRRCPDGSLPVYQSQSLAPPSQPAARQPAAPARQAVPQAPSTRSAPAAEPSPATQRSQPAAQPAPSYNWGQQPSSSSPQASAGDVGPLIGVWHTSVTGGVWTTPSAVPGYELLHVSPGVKAGDLTIDSGGYWAWNSWGGKTGRWEKGDASYPIVLVDTKENRRWKVGPDQRHPGKIFVWDGFYTYAGSR